MIRGKKDRGRYWRLRFTAGMVIPAQADDISDAKRSGKAGTANRLRRRSELSSELLDSIIKDGEDTVRSDCKETEY